MGPLGRPRSATASCRYVEAGTAEGARLVAGGTPIDGDRGPYMRPTVFDRRDPRADRPRGDLRPGAVRAGCSTTSRRPCASPTTPDYGLAAAVWTSDLSAAPTASPAPCGPGTVWVNCYEEGDMSVPFGGLKKSGNGRDKSLHALDEVPRPQDHLDRLAAAPTPPLIARSGALLRTRLRAPLRRRGRRPGPGRGGLARRRRTVRPCIRRTDPRARRRARWRAADGVLLPGGGDLHPRHYGRGRGARAVYDVDEEQDAFDLAVARHPPWPPGCRPWRSAGASRSSTWSPAGRCVSTWSPTTAVVQGGRRARLAAAPDDRRRGGGRLLFPPPGDRDPRRRAGGDRAGGRRHRGGHGASRGGGLVPRRPVASGGHGGGRPRPAEDLRRPRARVGRRGPGDARPRSARPGVP